MKTEEISEKHVGKRVLLTDRMTGVGRDEVEVLELSPSGQNVKLRNVSVGTTYWQEINEDEVVEILG